MRLPGSKRMVSLERLRIILERVAPSSAFVWVFGSSLERSYEEGEYRGLGILKGDVVRFDPPFVVDSPPLKVPHMGWNQLTVAKPNNPLLKGISPDASVYFVHSYYVRPDDQRVITTETDYGQRFTSMVWRDRLFATQFHPREKPIGGPNNAPELCGVVAIRREFPPFCNLCRTVAGIDETGFDH